jgi:hypothetical protein
MHCRHTVNQCDCSYPQEISSGYGGKAVNMCTVDSLCTSLSTYILMFIKENEIHFIRHLVVNFDYFHCPCSGIIVYYPCTLCFFIL